MIIRKSKNSIIFKRESLSTYRTMSGLLRGIFIETVLVEFYSKTVLLIYDSHSVLSLELEFVTECQLEYRVVAITLIENLGAADVITCIQAETLIFV